MIPAMEHRVFSALTIVDCGGIAVILILAAGLSLLTLLD
jgi:hypothetical protein